MMTISIKLSFYLFISTIILLAVGIQSHTLLNWDVSYLMHASQRLTQGGHYTQNFFETNPPMILFLYTLPVWCAKFLSLHFVISLRIYVFSVAFLSLALSWQLGKRIFVSSEKNYPILCYFIGALTITFLILPVYEFGQREHLTIMLVFPYLLACALRLSSQKISWFFAVMIGVLAGLGFAVKPFFLIPLCLIELGMIVYRHTFTIIFRPETFAILTVMLLYLFLVYWITPDYIHVILPLLFDLYYAGFHTSLIKMVLQDRFLFFLAPVIFFFISWKQKTSHKELQLILCIATIGFAITYLLENTLWFYHILPLLTLAIVLTCLLCTLSFPLNTTLSLNNFANLTYWTAFFWFPILLMIHFTTYLVQEKNQAGRYHLIQWLKQHKQYKSCYFLSTNAFDFPAVVDYADKISVSRFPNHWWLPGIIKLSELSSNIKFKNKIEAEKKYFINTVIEDIKEGQPDLLLVDARSYNAELQRKNINYFNYYSSQPQFKEQVKQYHFIEKVENFNIYARISAKG